MAINLENKNPQQLCAYETLNYTRHRAVISEVRGRLEGDDSDEAEMMRTAADAYEAVINTAAAGAMTFACEVNACGFGPISAGGGC